MHMNPYGKIFKALNDAQVQYIVVGGVAMNLLGYGRFTGDIDVLIALDHVNLKKMQNLMKEMGYEKRLPVDIQELGDEKKVLKLMKEKRLIAFTFINSAKPQFNIDVIVGESLRYRKYEAHRIIIETWGVPVPVISIDDLIGMKKTSNRTKDVEDVAALLELKGL